MSINIFLNNYNDKTCYFSILLQPIWSFYFYTKVTNYSKKKYKIYIILLSKVLKQTNSDNKLKNINIKKYWLNIEKKLFKVYLPKS